MLVCLLRKQRAEQRLRGRLEQKGTEGERWQIVGTIRCVVGRTPLGFVEAGRKG
jgi:hypothetical protein